MPLFVIRHQHEAERCPARDPQMGTMLLQHISPANARNFGINIHGEAVVNGEHTFYVIADAQSTEEVNQFMAPFTGVGIVEVMPASLCEEIVSRRGC
jgi:hypothetical protein